VRAALTRSFVESKSEPFERVEDRLFGIGFVSATIGIFDADDELSFSLLSEYPAKQGSANISDVGNTGWAGRVANSNRRDWTCHSKNFSSDWR